MKIQMKRFFVVIAMSSLLVSGVSVADSRLNMIEEAIESTALDIRMSNDLKGVIRGAVCDGCPAVLVKITPETKLEVNGIKTDLIKAKLLSGKPGLVIYDIKSKEVRMIKVYK